MNLKTKTNRLFLVFIILPTSTLFIACNGSKENGIQADLTIRQIDNYTPAPPPVDTSPDPFSFTARNNIIPNTIIESESITVWGINEESPIAISAGEYAIDNGDFTSASSMVSNGSTVTVRLSSPENQDESVSANLEIGDISSTFSVASTSATSPMLRENAGIDCAIPPLVESADLSTAIEGLPNPFTSMDGTQITQVSDWPCRRAEIGAQAEKYELGVKPSAENTVITSLNENTLSVSVEHEGNTLTFEALILLPENASPPYPAMIGMGGVFLNSSELLNMGVAIINFPNSQIAEQNNGSSRGRGLFYDLFGSEHSAGAMMAWSWGVSRLIDALQTTANTQIDASKLGITGCSRNGKGAIIAGAYDERIALTIGQESGSGGAASWRISDAQLAAGENVQTLRQIVTENVWFREDFSDFSESATLLPYDHHALMGMIAPRALLVIENEIDWLGIESTYASSIVAKEIWKAQGLGDNLGVSQTLAHTHCQQPASQQSEINAFVQKFLLGADNVDTHVDVNETGVVVDWTRWVDWTAPDLL